MKANEKQKKPDKQAVFWLIYRVFCGSPNWARTSDIMINSHALYRLSYGGSYKISQISLRISSKIQSNVRYLNVRSHYRLSYGGMTRAGIEPALPA